jgi:hypothetical protein
LGINLRKAKAGIKLLEEGGSVKQALIASGYSPKTAHTPKAKNLDAKACIAEAVKLDPSLEPAKLVQGARKVFQAKIQHALDDPEAITKARFSDIARFLEVAERSYTVQDGQDMTARSFVDRIEWLAELQAEIKARQPQDMGCSSPAKEQE